ncbi:MAG: glycosyltransferase [Muribaculaceae bacterium]|nr:glycosyltransferase [Muribaculaceae bacterium]
MQIALFTDTYLPQINGVATHVKTLKEGLEAIGHTVLVVTADTSARNHYINDGVLHCPAATLKHLYDYGAASSHSRERDRLLDDFAFDVVHIHTEFGIGWSGVETARRMKLPLFYTLHTMWEQYLHYIVPRPMIPIARKVMRKYIGYYGEIADEVIGPSARVQGFLESCGVRRHINVVPNAVELDYFSREQADAQRVQSLRVRYGLCPEDLVLCFCGRLGREKSIDVLLDMFAVHSQPDSHIKLVVIGDGPQGLALREQAKQLGIADSVIFVGGVPHDQVREIYACCDLFATASRSEVNSISMLEAMAMGLPVLHIVDEENPGQVQEGVNGLPFRTAEEFHEIIQGFQRNPGTLRQMQASTVESVRTAGQEGLARRMESVYLKKLAVSLPHTG